MRLFSLKLVIAFLFISLFACSEDSTDSQNPPNPDGDVEADSESSITTWEFPKIKIEGREILDEHGRNVMLRGINVGGRAKMPPFIPWEGDPNDESFEVDHEKYMDFPADWAMNCIRLTVFWEAIEPEKGKYDEKYLDFVETQIEAARKRGMYVFLDFHQDLFSRYYGGSGAPSWALDNPPAEPPTLDNTTWFLKVFADQTVLAAFDRFWGNMDGIQEAYSNMVVHVAKRFKDYPNVLGVDLINEPNPGLEGKSDLQKWYTEKLIPFYSSLTAKIREHAPHYIMFLEPSGLEASGGASEENWTMDNIENYILTPHYYYPTQYLMGEYDGKTEDIIAALNDKNLRGKDLNVPVLLSEYGFRGSQTKPGDDVNAGKFFDDFYDIMDAVHMHGTVWTHEASNTYWNQEDCSFVNGDWSERVPRADAVSRPYPEFTSGKPISFKYDPKTKNINYKYEVYSNVTKPTIIRLAKRHYKAAPQVKLAFGSYEYVETLGLLLIFDSTDDFKPEDKQEQTVEIKLAN